MLDDQTTLQFNLEQDGLVDAVRFYIFGTVWAALCFDIFKLCSSVKLNIYSDWNDRCICTDPLL
ncbi:hypothetical protein D1872_277050 [compost metagenome]